METKGGELVKDQRIEVILDRLKKKGIVSTLELTEELSVTEMTIRRDLKYLEDKKLLIRIHGGAKSIKKIQQEKLYGDRKIKYMKEKEYIAKIAAKSIQDNETIFIAPGTTTERIPEFIKAKNVTIVTNSYSIIAKYSNLDLDIIVAGGRLRRETEAIIGDYFLDSIGKLNVDKCFIGANGINGNKVTISNYDEGLIQKIVIENAKEKYLLLDSSKFNKEAFYSFSSLDILDGIITDKNLKQDIIKEYRSVVKIINI